MRLPITGTLNAALFDNILRECQPCIQGRDRKLDLDLSSAEWGYPSGLVPVANLLKTLSMQGTRIEVVGYPESSVCSYYCRMDFFRRIGLRSPCRTAAKSTGEGRFVEITELRDAQIKQETSAKLSNLLQRLPKSVTATETSRRSFIDACGELVSNTRHAYDARIDGDIATRPRALMQAQFYPKRGTVEFCVCDCGVGIKRSMEGEHAVKYRSHSESIQAALAYRNKAPQGDGAGLGLAALESYIKRNGGTLRVRSGDSLQVQRGRRCTSTEHLPDWSGTIVVLEIIVEKTADLSKIWLRLGR